MKTAIIKVEYKDHTKIVLTNRHGDTYTSESESLMDFFCNAEEDVSMLQPKWIPVTERLPKVNHSLLMYKRDHQYPHTNGYCIGSFDGENWLYMSLTTVDPTHWTALPEPPNH